MKTPTPLGGYGIAPAPRRCGSLLAATTLIAGLLATDVDAVPIVIDDFSTGFQLVSVNTTTTYKTSTVAAASALGGTRTLDIRLTSPGGNADALVSPGGEGLVIGGASSTGTAQINALWTPGGVDLTAGGWNDLLVLDFHVLDPGGLATTTLFEFLFTSTGGDTASMQVAVPEIPPNPATVLLDLASASLTPLAGNAAFTMNQTIQMTVWMDRAADFALNSLHTDRREVPDGGSTLVLLGTVASLAGGIKWRLRRLGR